MKHYFSAALVVAAVGLPVSVAQEIVPVNHDTHHNFVEGGSCATGQCGTCNDCVRVNDIKVTKHPVYSCTIKEICIPNRSLLGLFHGSQDGCRKIEIPQLVKKYRSDEQCVSKCMTAEDAAKHYEAEAKKAADKAKSQMPAPTPAPAKLPSAAVGYAPGAPTPVSFAPAQPRLSPPTFYEVRQN